LRYKTKFLKFFALIMGQVGAVIKYGKFSLIRKHHCINAQIISFYLRQTLI